jgi:hypothetical protein
MQLVLVVAMPYTTSEFDRDKQEMFELAVALAAGVSICAFVLVSVFVLLYPRMPCTNSEFDLDEQEMVELAVALAAGVGMLTYADVC